MSSRPPNKPNRPTPTESPARQRRCRRTRTGRGDVPLDRWTARAANDRNLYSIVLVDVAHSARAGVQWQRRMRNDLYNLMDNVVRYRGLNLESLPFNDIGDAIRLVVPLDRIQPTQVVDLFILGLAAGLRDHRRCASESARIRLRVAFDLGLLERHKHGWAGDSLVRTARLIEGAPVRDALAADRRLDIAAVVSDQMYESVIRHGYGHISPSCFRPVQICHKEFDARAWLLTPGADRQCPHCHRTAA
jgi:hypothetical protein